jgi:(2Fe-2S) ferredoxin
MTEHLAGDRQSPEPISILVCQHLTCKKQGAAQVLAAIRSNIMPGITGEGCGCLGRCGNGSNVLVLPARIWYHRVRPSEVPELLNREIDRQQI